MEEKVFEVSNESLKIEPLQYGERRLIVAQLVDWPAWGGNHCASVTTPNSFLRWRGEVACEWQAIRKPTEEECKEYLKTL